MEGPKEQENTYAESEQEGYEIDERDEALKVEMKKGKEMKRID
jgi:hypothetical protein